ncbi:MAG: cytochrome d ubiquinol oxidase subunit II [Muribaculaceae bacterium]|nr:cytochrome d ubiquinol oxidase subunit II [Muribaculaceae bacterium]
MTLDLLQNYWWVIVSVLGGILVFLLFVQGGQSMLLNVPDSSWTQMIVQAIGRKWELTFTTLVTFGGAAFAAFPLFYSTSFGGAYWLWMLILISFVVQAVSYEYRCKPGNLLGSRIYDIFLFFNGLVGCVLLGVAVAMFFFGGEFTVSRGAMLDSNAPVVSVWASTHGFEAIFCWKNLLLGGAVFFLARVLAALYLMNAVNAGEKFYQWMKKKLWWSTGLFLVFFLAFLAVLLTSDGYTVLSSNSVVTEVELTPFKYWHNLISSPSILILLLLGVANVLLGILRTLFTKVYTQGIWFAGIGTFFTVVALFWMAGFCDTPFLPSVTDPASSLTIRNASSSQFTLQTMTYVSILIPFVVAYIWYVWKQIDAKKITKPESEH